MPNISVIVPVYKAESLIERCIKGILMQTYKDFELILVDDGSPDTSGQICDAFSLIDSRIRVIHKKNGGPSDSRNAGLDIAVGKWIVFIDADDYIDNDYLQNLLNGNPKEDPYLLSMMDNRNVNLAGDHIPTGREPWHNELITIGQNQDLIVRYQLLHNNAIYCKLFSSSIIKQYHLRFNTKIKHCEDGLFINQYELHIKYIFLSANISYNYVVPGANKYSISQNETQSIEAIYELAKCYSKLSIAMIEKFHLQKQFEYCNRIMSLFICRYCQIISNPLFDNIPISKPSLKYYQPIGIRTILFKYLLYHLPPQFYRNINNAISMLQTFSTNMFRNLLLFPKLF